MVRLFVGGLPPSVHRSELEARFVPFGRVAASELAEPKGLSQASDGPAARGFAYVELEPKDEGAIAKCLSLYNHSKWKGHKLRVEVARPDYLARMTKEQQEEAENNRLMEQEAEAQRLEKQQQQPSTKAIYVPIPGRKRKVVKAPLDGSLPDGKKRPKRTHFPPVQPLPLPKLAWSAPVSAFSALYKKNEVLYMPSMPAGTGATAATATPADVHKASVEIAHTYAPAPAKVPHILPHEQHGYLKILKAVDTQVRKHGTQTPQPHQTQRPKQGQKAATAPVMQRALDEPNNNVVDFSDDEQAHNKAAVDLDKFGSDSDDEVPHTAAPNNQQRGKRQALHQPKQLVEDGPASKDEGQAQGQDSEDRERTPGAHDWDSDEVPQVSGEDMMAVDQDSDEEHDQANEEVLEGEAERQVGDFEEQEEVLLDEPSVGRSSGEDEEAEAVLVGDDADGGKGLHSASVAEAEEEEEQDDEAEAGEAGEGEEAEEILPPVPAASRRRGTAEQVPAHQALANSSRSQAMMQLFVPARPQGRGHTLDLSRFGSDSDEEFHDVDEDDERAGPGPSAQQHTAKAGRTEKLNAGAAFVQVAEGRGRGVVGPQPGRQVAMPAGQAAGTQRQQQQQQRQQQQRPQQHLVAAQPQGNYSGGQQAVMKGKQSVASTPTSPAERLHAGVGNGRRAAAASMVGRPEPTVPRSATSLELQQQQPTQAQPTEQQQQQQQQVHHVREALESPAVVASRQPTTPSRSTAAQPVRKPLAPAYFSFNFVGGAASSLLPQTQQTLPAAAHGQGPGRAVKGATAGSPGADPATSAAAVTSTAAVKPALGLGLSFVRPADKSDAELRKAWEQQREALTADFKSKQRTALKHAAGPKKARPARR